VLGFDGFDFPLDSHQLVVSRFQNDLLFRLRGAYVTGDVQVEVVLFNLAISTRRE
jgi:hypothetical protein